MSSNKGIFSILFLKYLFNTYYVSHYPTELIWLIISFILESRVQIKCSSEQTAILHRSTGKVYVCGNNRSSQIGIPQYQYKITNTQYQYKIPNIPEQVMSLNKIEYIDFEGSNLIAYDTNNKRHSCQDDEYVILSPEVESFISYLPNTIACASTYRLFLCKDNNLYSVYQGINNKNDLQKIKFPNYPCLKIIQFSYDANCSFVLVKNYNYNSNYNLENELYGWGLNNCGQLGLGDTKDRNTPTKINISRIIFFSTGMSHVVAIDSSNDVWVWGAGGPLGLGDLENQLTPQKLPPTKKDYSSGMWCGSYIST